MAKGRGGSLWTPANIVTIARIVLVPAWLALAEAVRAAGLVGVGAPLAWASALLYGAISLTDKLDGYLARSRGEVTDFGKFLDPIADKLSVAICMVYLLELGLTPSWMLLVVLAREFVVSGMRMVVAAKGEVVAASGLGKAKTATTMSGLCGLMVVTALPAGPVSGALLALSNICMWVAMGLTAYSGADYLVKCWPLIAEG